MAAAKNFASFRSRIAEEAPSPITYDSTKPKDLLDEGKEIKIRTPSLKPEIVRIIGAEVVFVCDRVR